MKFNVGPYVYTLTIGATPVNADTSLPARAVFDADARLITISPTVPSDHRHELLIHELTHAWRHHVPKPRTEEEAADLTAMIATAAAKDLEREGGRRALEVMVPVVSAVVEVVEAGLPVRELRYVPIEE